MSTTKTETHQCAAKVYPSGSYYGYACKAAAKFNEDDEWWCRHHAPSQKEAKARERRKKWKDEDAARDQLLEQSQARLRAIMELTGVKGHVDVNRKFDATGGVVFLPDEADTLIEYLKEQL